MPTYDYKCLECKKEFDNFETSISKAEEVEKELKCPNCSSDKKERLVSKSTGFILNGPNWFGNTKRGDKRGY